MSFLPGRRVYLKDFTIHQGGNWIQAPKGKKVLSSSCFMGGSQKFSVVMPDMFIEPIEISEEDVELFSLRR
jgi:hypothetical protein